MNALLYNNNLLYSFVLLLTMTHWQLKQTPQGLTLKNDTSKTSFMINFTNKNIKYRLRASSIKKETIARAAGLKTNTQPIIIYATAGLGRDAFIIAGLGFHIYLLERCPLIHALLSDALTRRYDDPTITQIVQRMKLIQANSIDFLTQPDTQADIIFIDPMFPQCNKSALPQKAMQIFHDVVGQDTDANQLLAAAMACASQRVVLKRPRLAVPLSLNPPDFSLPGKSCRFDVYLTRKHK